MKHSNGEAQKSEGTVQIRKEQLWRSESTSSQGKAGRYIVLLRKGEEKKSEGTVQIRKEQLWRSESTSSQGKAERYIVLLRKGEE